MKRTALSILALLLGIAFIVPTLSAEEVHKRIVDGKEEYELRIANETGWFVVVHIDGKRQAVLNPAKKYSVGWDGSMAKTWLTPGLHKFLAFAYKSQKNITDDRPFQKTPESLIDITKYLDNERQPSGAFKVPVLELEKSNFEPWTAPIKK